MIIHKSIKKNSYSLILFAGSLLLLILLTVLLVPKISARLFPQGRVLSSFLQQTEQTKQIDAQSFWQMREFYSPGYFRVDKNGIEIPHDQVSFVKLSTPLPFSLFTAPSTKSYDFLVGEASLSAYLSNPYSKVLLHTPSLLISESNQTTLIAFILPTAELLKANGFFKVSQDSKLLEGKYWLDITLLKRN